jgi:hypothetical protein
MLPGKDVKIFQNHITELKSINTNCNITLCHQLQHYARIRSNPYMIKTNERFIGLLWLKAGMQEIDAYAKLLSLCQLDFIEIKV